MPATLPSPSKPLSGGGTRRAPSGPPVERRGPPRRPILATLIALATILQFADFARALVADWAHLNEAAGTQAISTLRLFGAFLPSTLLLVAGVLLFFGKRSAAILFALFLAWGLWWLGSMRPGIEDTLRLALAAVGLVYSLVRWRRERRAAPTVKA